MKKTLSGLPVTTALIMAATALLYGLMGGIPARAANDATKFTWSVPVGTCTVSTNSPIKLGEVDPTPALGIDWPALNKTPVSISLRDCMGAAGNTRPVVSVSGGTITIPNASPFMFKTQGTSVGFGFILLKSAQAAGSNGSDIEVKNTESLYIPKPGNPSWFGSGDTLSGNYSIPLNAAVTCGRKAWCTEDALKAGDLKATVTFTFSYK